MKILQILPQLNFGGVEVGTIDLAQALIDRGHKAYVISAGGELVGRLVKMGAVHYELPVHKKSLRTLAMVKKVREIIDREGIDIVHARSRVPAWVAYFATRNSGAKFVTTCHGYYSKHFMSKIMGWGERVIVISRAVGRRMIDDFGVLPDRITLIHRGVDTQKYSFDKDKMSSECLKNKEKFIIANIGRLTPIKGHEYFIKAIHLALHSYQNIEAWIVGGSQKNKLRYLEELKVLINKLGIESNVIFKGVDSNVSELLKKVDLLVLSTTYPEGFGRVVIEAGASGVPVVATKVGGIPDIIDDGKNGLLVPPNDEIRLSQAIIQVLREPNKAKAMALNLRKKIETQFTIKLMIDKTIEVYEEVRKRRRILVIKLGSIGDIILAIPSLRMLRKKFSDGYIAVLVDDRLVNTLDNCPYIDEIIPYKRSDKKHRVRHLKNIVLKLRKQSFDISIDFQNNAQTHLIAFLSGIPLRYGYKRGFFGRILTSGVGMFKGVCSPVKHQFRVLSFLGITECDETLELWPGKEDYDYIKSAYQSVWGNEKQKVIGFVFGASKRWKSKRWSIEKFNALAKVLIGKLNCRIVLIGDESSKPERDRFELNRNNAVLDLIGLTTINQLAALMKNIDCVVCADTAPLHVACAMKTKIVALFGPTDPRRHLSPSTNSRVIRKSISCSPCYKEVCPESHRCMNDITVDEVLQVIQQMI